ncbi:hypothetical protein GOODEAATRI_026462 [Goodea atripinnis]|uniref:Uncharacterized protein n=1 Tax=Goodea atripinnis TaxID=208336 RepID=A0ABV0MVI3_9TELE
MSLSELCADEYPQQLFDCPFSFPSMDELPDPDSDHPSAPVQLQSQPSDHCTCTADRWFLTALAVVRQVVGITPPTGCRWNSAFLPPRLLRPVFSHQTSRQLEACCTRSPFSILALRL